MESDVVSPGDRGTVVGALGVRVGFIITAVEPGQLQWAWRVQALSRSVRMEHGIDPAGPGSTAWVLIHLPTPLVALYAPLARRALRRLVSG